ncbi:hypothetical protein MC885_013723 [Smutsia gigantea]|nr:hypothetical protein MC885_013723 [Smutsia gigantea]
MVPRVWSLMRLLIKGSVAGGAVYLVYAQDLLGPSDKSQATLQKAEAVFPPAIYQFSQYVCEKTGLKIPQVPRAGSEAKAWQKGHPCLVPSARGHVLLSLPKEAGWGPGPFPFHQALLPSLSSQLPAFPKFTFHIRESWNSGIITVVSALSVAPAKAREHSREGWEYLRQLTK